MSMSCADVGGVMLRGGYASHRAMMTFRIPQAKKRGMGQGREDGVILYQWKECHYSHVPGTASSMETYQRVRSAPYSVLVP